MKSLLAFVLRSADATIAVSKRLAAEMVALEPRSRPAVVGNTVHPSFFATPLDSAPSGGPIRVLFVGRLRDAFKGLDRLLHAVGQVRAMDAQTRVRLTVVGDGALRYELERLAAECAGGSVEFLGALPAAEVPPVMAACHVFVMPSSYETFGLVFAEAMAAGKPVIGCLGTAAEEIVPGFAGILVPPNDDIALTLALRQAIQDIGRFDRARIRAYAREHFSYEAFVGAVERVYDSVMTPLAGERAGTRKSQ
jgi:glycosyltransferase involved in cell wall biosynthesis